MTVVGRTTPEYRHDFGLASPGWPVPLFETAKPGDTTEIGPYDAGTELVFFIETKEPSGAGSIFFSTGDQAIVTEQGYGAWRIAWEDVPLRYSDQDFDDLVVEVELL